MDAGFFDVLHDRADDGCLAVGNTIDIDLDRVFEKAIDQYGPVRRDFNRVRHITAQVRFVVNELHRAPTENETWPNEHGITNFGSDRDRLVGAHDRTAWRLSQAELVQHRREKFSIFRGLDALRLRS